MCESGNCEACPEEKTCDWVITIEDIESHMKQRKKWNNLDVRDVKLFRDGNYFWLLENLINNFNTKGKLWKRFI